MKPIFTLLLFICINSAFAQTGLSGEYGCTIKDEFWGKTPKVGQEYDRNGLIFTIDFSRNLMSGIELRYKFDSTMKVIEISKFEYKNEPVTFKATGLKNIFILQDGNDVIYFTIVNGGNTILLANPPNGNYIGGSGACQKM
jgi:hypothetical protein